MEFTAEERKRALRKLSNPQSWPCWPFLPMKRMVDGHVENGFAVTADYPTVVLRGFPTMDGIILQLAYEDGVPVPGGGHLRHASAEERVLYEDFVEYRYEDLDGLLDDGWRID
jgi:hypothetical protein